MAADPAGGTDPLGPADPEEAVSISGHGGAPLAGGLRGWFERVETSTALPLAVYADGPFAGTPAVTVNHAGDGRAVYVAGVADAGALRAVHHDGRVPAEQSTDAALERLVAGERRFLAGGDGVDVVGAGERRHADLTLARPLQQLQHHVAGSVPAPCLDDAVQGLQPFGGLCGVDVGQIGWQAVENRADLVLSHFWFLSTHTIGSLTVGCCRSRHPTVLWNASPTCRPGPAPATPRLEAVDGQDWTLRR